MSQAKQCDRCGMLYIPYAMSPNNSIIIHKCCELVDLCPDCYSDLKTWLANDADVIQTIELEVEE